MSDYAQEEEKAGLRNGWPVYYMRDNHTFRPLSNDVEEALTEIHQEWVNGFTCGMLHSNEPGAPAPVHAKGRGNWPEFRVEAKAFYAALPKTSTIGDRVKKTGGSFEHTGTVQAIFKTRSGQDRIVIEFDDPVAGMLFIYRPDQVCPLSSD